MPMYRVTTSSRKRKIIVSASTLQEISLDTTATFGLTQYEEYKVSIYDAWIENE